MVHEIMAASAVAPGTSYTRAIAQIQEGLADPVLGPVGTKHMQLCPQHAGRLTEDVVDRLMSAYPDTRFRLHAIPRVGGDHRHRILDAVNVFEAPEQLAATVMMSRRVGATGYSIHAGATAHGSLDKAFRNVRHLADLFGCRVGIEGLYPSPGGSGKWLLGTWSEYERLLEEGVDYAIDLSHLNIVVKRERTRRDDLVRDLVSSPHCIEVHVSCNDGRADSHRPLDPASPPWWTPLMAHVHPDAVVFYEGVLLDPRRRPKG